MNARVALALLVVLATACIDASKPLRPGGPNALISDAVHGAGGNPNFYWLPPMVPAPTPTGEFNGQLDPVVVVCEFAGGSCISTLATFTTTSGPGSETVRVGQMEGLYAVNWHTNEFVGVEPGHVFRISVSVFGKELGFADVEIALTGKEAKNLNDGTVIGLLDGRTLPIKFRIELGAACNTAGAECTEAFVDPAITQTVEVLDDGGNPLAFATFPAGWTDETEYVKIERLPDSEDGTPGTGPLGTEFPQYPLFFEYFTTAPEPFNRFVRIGVCQVESAPGEEDPFHAPNAATLVLGKGGPGEFERILPRISNPPELENCTTATANFPPPDEGGEGGGEIGALVPLNQLLTPLGEAARWLLTPQSLHAATTVVVDGGMGGEVTGFSPVGAVDTATEAADLTIHTLSVAPSSPTTSDAVTITATVSNSGDAPAAPSTVSVCVAQFAEGGLSASCNVFEGPAVPSGASVPVSAEFGSLFPGEYTLTASIDTFEVVPESDEENNKAIGPTFFVDQVDQQQLIFDAEGLVLAITNAPTSEQKLAQVVTTGVTGNLVGVRVPVSCSSGALVVQIQGVTEDLPDGSSLTSETVLPAALPSPLAFREVRFSTPAHVWSGEQFAIVLSNTTGGCQMAQGPVGDPYLNGSGFFDARPNPAGVWLPLSGDRDDLPFMTIVRP